MARLSSLLTCGGLNGHLNRFHHHAEKKRVLDNISSRLKAVDQLLSTGIATVPSEEFIELNQNNEAMFKIIFVPGTQMYIELLLNQTVVKNWDNCLVQGGWKPIHIICAVPDVQPNIVKYILDNSADDINVTTVHYKYTALIIAASVGNFSLVKFLLANGAHINDISEIPVDSDALLHVSHYTYRRLLSKSDLFIPPLPYNFSPLVAAIFYGHKDIILYLLQSGADVKINSNTWTTIFQPTLLGKIDIVMMLLEHGFDVNARDQMGSTALHKAAEKGMLDMADLLLTHGADANATDNYGWTPLHVACLHSKISTKGMVQLLLDSNADVNAQTKTNFTALNLAIAGFSNIFLKFLLITIDKLNPKSAPFELPPVASTEEHCELIKLLVYYGAKYNQQDCILNWSPLHWAAAEGDVNVMKQLLSYGAAVDTKSKMAMNPLETAIYFKKRVASEILKSAKDFR